jgi:WD40 repeat protein
LSVGKGGGEFHYNADGSILVLNYGLDTGNMKELRILSTKNDELLLTITTRIFTDNQRHAFEISPDGNYLVTLDENFNIWSIRTGEFLFRIKTEPWAYGTLLGWTISADSKELIHFNGTHIYRHSLESGELNSELYLFDIYRYSIHPTAFSADSKIIAVGLNTVGDTTFGGIRIFRVAFFSIETGAYIGDISVLSSGLGLLAFSPDGNYLFTSDYKTLGIYEVPQLTNSWMDIFKTKQGIPKNVNSNKPLVWTTERVQSSG